MTRLLTMMLSVMLASSAIAAAQDKASVQEKAAAPAVVVSLKVQLVISRYQGEKKVSSVPYTMSVTAGDPRYANGRLRIGAQIPIPSGPTTAAGDGKASTPPPFTYRDVGTNIDCVTSIVGDRQYQLQISIDQSSVISDDQLKQSGSNVPFLRSFRLTNTAILKDGQTTEFATATDAVSGEVVKIEVTINVAK